MTTTAAVEATNDLTEPGCECMTEDLNDGWGERVVTHSGECPEHPEFDAVVSQ